jgi:histidyl-tRNA synthetase
MAQSVTARVKGTRDFYPEDWEYIRWLSGKWLELGRSYGYQEYEGPVLEHIELYLGKSSEEIVNEQTFTMKDRDGKTLVMRPELTPTLARMIAEREGTLTFPARWQSFGQFFRYEKPQRGRGRAFYQWNIDILGTESVAADAEILCLACQTLEVLGILPADATIRVNNRASIVELIGGRLGLEEAAVRPLLARIDRLEKIGEAAFRSDCSGLGLSAGQIDDLLGLLADRDAAFSPPLERAFEEVARAGLGDYLAVDRRIVRGFDYYTGIVFEAWATGTLRRALFGGGRYDNLTLQVGGKKKIPGVGFAPGDMAMGELLKETGRFPDFTSSHVRVLVAVFGRELAPEASALAHELRSQGVPCELYVDSDHRLDRQLKYADRRRIPYLALVGPDEKAGGTVVLKDLAARTQRSVARSAVARELASP